MTKQIIWKRWVDPFLQRKEAADKLKAELCEDDSLLHEAAVDTFFDEDERDDGYDDETKENRIGPGIITMFGVVPLNEHNTPSRIYNFWMGHTNFDLTNAVKNILKTLPGVETLDIVTRYRFRVGIGKAFDGAEVRESIDKALCEQTSFVGQEVPEPPKPVDARLALLQKQLASKHKFWAILVMKNGKLQIAGSDDSDAVKKEIDNKVAETDNVLTSWDVNESQTTSK